MVPLAAGLIVLLLLVLLARSFLSANIKRLVKGVRGMAGIVLVLAAVGLVAIGRIGLAFLAGSIAWTLLTGARVRLGFGSFGQRFGHQGAGKSPPADAMLRAEALKVLNLKEGASEADIRAAHRRLIIQNHPDRGGSDYLAAKINQAKDVLLRS